MDYVLLGSSAGMANALLAVGLVLIFKSNRVISFTIGEFGAFGVGMLYMLTRTYDWGYWPALLVALSATAVLAAVIERTIIQRLFASPRLMVLLATLGIAQVVIVLRLVLPKPKVGGQSSLIGGSSAVPVPFHFDPIRYGRVVLLPADVMILVVAPLLALAVVAFLRYSIYGIAIRAAAENASRARLLGIPVRRVSTMAWVISGVLAAMGAILLAPKVGFTPSEAVGIPLLVRALAAATLAEFESVPVAFGWGLALGIADQVVFLETLRNGESDAVIFAGVLVLLLLRRGQQRRTTASEESSWQIAEPVRALPEEIRVHPRWRAVTAVGVALLVAAVALAPFVLPESRTFLLGSIFAISIATVSLTMLTGWAGQLSLGHWALVGVGAVVGSRLHGVYGWDFWVVFALIGLVGAAFALLMGLPALRLPGTLLAVVTIGFAVVCHSWLFQQPWFRGNEKLERPEWLTTRWFYLLTVVCLVTALLVMRTLQRSRFGRNVVAVRDNPVQAAAFGISVTRTKLTAFVLSGAMASYSGYLWAAGVTGLGFDAFSPIKSITILSAAIIGGLGSIGGAVLGTAYMLGFQNFATGDLQFLQALSGGLGLLVLVLFLPGGLARLAFGVRDVLARLVTGLDPRPDVVPVSASTAMSAAGPTPEPRVLAEV